MYVISYGKILSEVKFMKVLTVDIDGTYIRYACMDEFMNIGKRGKIFTPQEGREDLIESVARIFEAVGDAQGIAVSMPGIIDSAKGYCIMGGALRYNDDFYFRHALYERCKTKIHIENNAKCAAMAEAAVGSLIDVEDGFFLIFSTMVGGAYIKDRRVYGGKHFAAGEVSYIVMDREGVPGVENVWGKNCGLPQLLESYSSATGMDIETVDLQTIFDAVGKGESAAVDCLNKYVRQIAVRIFNIQTVLDPERFAIGGEISAQPLFMDSLRRQLKDLYAACPYNIPQAAVVASKYQTDANLIGALQFYLADD